MIIRHPITSSHPQLHLLHNHKNLLTYNVEIISNFHMLRKGEKEKKSTELLKPFFQFRFKRTAR